MPIRVTCSKCHTRFNVSDKFAGKEGPCPKCKSTIKIPAANEEVVIHAPKSGAVDSKGRPLLKPIKRKETSLSTVQITIIIVSIVGFLLCALVMRFMIKPPQTLPYWLLGVSAMILAVPLVFVGYAFLRDQEREGFWGKELWYRVLICAVAFAVSWIALPIAAYAFNDNYETGSYVLAGVAMFAIGTIASMACFDFDAIMGSVLFGLYMGTGLLGRWLAGAGIVPVTAPKGTVPEKTKTVMLFLEETMVNGIAAIESVIAVLV